MNSTNRVFRTSQNIVGKDGAFSIDQPSKSSPFSYLRDRYNQIVGFTYKGKHVFLRNVQKNKLGTLFPTAKYNVDPEELNKIMYMYSKYLDTSVKDNVRSPRDEFFKNGKHIFVQIKKEDNFIKKITNLFKKKKPDTLKFENENRRIKFKEVNTAVLLEKPKPKTVSAYKALAEAKGEEAKARIRNEIAIKAKIKDVEPQVEKLPAISSEKAKTTKRMKTKKPRNKVEPQVEELTPMSDETARVIYGEPRAKNKSKKIKTKKPRIKNEINELENVEPQIEELTPMSDEKARTIYGEPKAKNKTKKSY